MLPVTVPERERGTPSPIDELPDLELVLLAGIDVEGLSTLLLRLDVEPPAGILPAEAAALEVIEDGRMAGAAITALFGTGAGLGIGFDT